MSAGQILQKARYIAESKAKRDAARDAEEVVGVLNYILEGAPESRLLKPLAETWIESNYQLDRWPYRDRFEKLVKNFPRRLTQHEFSPVRLDSGVGFQGDKALFDDESGRDVAKDIAEWEDNKAAEYFLTFITGPFFDKIARCEKCGLFILKTRSDRTYCSQKCASAVTALTAHRQRRKQERQDNIEKVRGALSKWNEKRKRDERDKKAWLATKTGLSHKFITIALREIGEFEQGGQK
jgi:hypothetical protein